MVKLGLTLGYRGAQPPADALAKVREAGRMQSSAAGAAPSAMDAD